MEGDRSHDTDSAQTKEDDVDNAVRRVKMVSDGIMVELHNGTACYLSSDMLLHHAQSASTPKFLNYDPSEASTSKGAQTHGNRDLPMTGFMN